MILFCTAVPLGPSLVFIQFFKKKRKEEDTVYDREGSRREADGEENAANETPIEYIHFSPQMHESDAAVNV